MAPHLVAGSRYGCREADEPTVPPAPIRPPPPASPGPGAGACATLWQGTLASAGHCIIRVSVMRQTCSSLCCRFQFVTCALSYLASSIMSSISPSSCPAVLPDFHPCYPTVTSDPSQMQSQQPSIALFTYFHSFIGDQIVAAIEYFSENKQCNRFGTG